MATINIGAANAEDQFYSYTIPELQARVGANALHNAPGLCAKPCSCSFWHHDFSQVLWVLVLRHQQSKQQSFSMQGTAAAD